MPSSLRSFWNTFTAASCYAALTQPLIRATTSASLPLLAISTSRVGICINPAFHTALVLGQGYSSSPAHFPIPSSPLLTIPTCPVINKINKINNTNNMTVTAHYSFAGHPNIIFGQPVEPLYLLHSGTKGRSWNADKDAAKRNFQPAPGVYRARDLVSMFAPLLDTCIRRVGREDRRAQEATRDVLLAGLAAILATSGRESSLALRTGRSGDEMARQADSIGAALVGYAREALDPEGADGDLRMVSHCDGHLWTHEVVGALMGPRGDSVVMQLYNEWSHRIVLLRNALMPFENWDEVPLVVAAAANGKEGKGATSASGMRVLEGPSDAFVMRLLSGRLPQKAIVDMAKSLTAPGLPSGGFGFQYSQGTVLPAFMAGSPSRSLLRYYPAREADSPAPEVLFEYEYPSYEAAERSELPAGKLFSSSSSSSSPTTADLPTTVPSVLRSRPLPGSQGLRATLQIEVELRGHPEAVFPVCLGQIARGRRYAARVPKGGEAGRGAALADAPANSVLHRVEDALALPGLVFSAAEDPPQQQQQQQQESTLHVFPVSDPLLSLALFGKLYPGNVVVLGEKDDLASALRVGRGFGTKFVHWTRS